MKPHRFVLCSRFGLLRTVRKLSKSQTFIRLGRAFAEATKEKDPKALAKTPEEFEALQQAEVQRLIPHSYSPPLFSKVNEPKYIQRMKKLELELAKERKIIHPRTILENHQMPLLLILLLALFFYFWSTVPYPVIFRPFTVSEYLFRNPGRYWYTPFSSALSIKTLQDFQVYFPLAAYSLFQLAWQFNSKMYIIGFLVNVASTFPVLLAAEKSTLEPGQLMLPKTNGGSTALFYAFALLGLQPSHRTFNSSLLPFALFCFAALAFDLVRIYDAKETTKESRSAHVAAAMSGLVFGAVIRHRGLALGLK